MRTKIQALLELTLPTLTVAFGLQTLRLFLPLVVNHYGVRPGVTTIGMGLYAFAIFLSAFLTAAVRRLLGPKIMLALTAGGLGLLRLAMQFSPTAAVSLNLATAGTVLFIFFLPVYLARSRADGSQGTGSYALAILLGLTMDTAIHGICGTYDLIWQRSAGAIAAVIVLVAAQLAVLARALRTSEAHETSDTPFLSSIPLLAIGPLIFLEGMLLQNIAQVTTRSAWSQPVVFAWLMLANVIGIVVAVLLISQPRWRRWPVTLLAGLALLPATWPPSLSGGAISLGILSGQAGAAALLTLILLAQGSRADRPGLWRTTIAHGLGMFLFAILTFAYYAGYDLSLPFDNVILLPIAAVVVTLCALGASLRSQKESPADLNWVPVWLAVLLLLLPLFSWATWSTPGTVMEPTHASATASGWPIRIMTYNLHQGFDTDGHLGMEALARVIDGTGADVIAMQEISRGWFINSSLDMLPWLSQRLGMRYLFGPAADSIWGNAILSRYPILQHGLGSVPKGDGVMKRGYLWARLDMGNGEDLLVIATHLHHIETEHEVRIPQVQTILDFWGGRERTIILGDMNSWPDSPEMDLFRDAGLQDAFALVGRGDGYTFASNDLYERIDYLWVTPGLQVSELVIPESTASDHLGVALTVGR